MKIPPNNGPIAVKGIESQTVNEYERKRNEKIMEVSKKFEALFVNQMVSAMRKTVSRGGLIPESHGEKVYRSMLDYEHSQKISESGQIGLSKMIYDHLLRTQLRR